MDERQRQVLRHLIASNDNERLERYYLQHVFPHDKRSALEILNDSDQ